MREQLTAGTEEPPTLAVAALQELRALSPLLTPPAAPLAAAAAATATVSAATFAAAAALAPPPAPLPAFEAWRARELHARASALLSRLPHHAALAVCHLGKLHWQVRARLRVAAGAGAGLGVWSLGLGLGLRLGLRFQAGWATLCRSPSIRPSHETRRVRRGRRRRCCVRRARQGPS